MLATPGPLPTGDDWLFEVKWDGMRVIADVADGTLQLATRTGRDVTANFPELAGLAELAPDVVLDGEVVLLDGGVPSFDALAHRMHSAVSPSVALARPVTFMVFDVLRLYGVDLTDRPLAERRATLDRLDLDGLDTVASSPLYPDGEALMAVTGERGMEGVVAKRADSVYRAGRRSPSWVKVTHRYSQTCLIGGWRSERTSVLRIGALLLGVPDDDGGMTFAGRVGSGLAGSAVQQVLAERLAPVTTAASPFGGDVPRVDANGAHWTEPTIVVEVAHLGWTAAGRLRQPVFRGVRDDVEPSEIRRERG
ncbi:bifunctional non-homologous end joining protein LigD [Pseudonocardia sediminis]|uniref:DNA ligase (ATP) n=1 Tax=Pseudonocardia sediminis TaxID=1397368 RepID=A0A4Q7UP67_PSEST|nr:non-homologous end-joining DNA ligase [Pseudonocardia sediminis]RZT83527.1 bifunctional non-homologous end joining protein LigD [Pseudonocardia sediminis]